MSVFKPKDSKFFRYDFRCGGRRFHGNTGETTRRAAAKVERDKREAAKVEVARLKAQREAPMTIDVAAGQYWLQVGKHHVNWKTTQRDLARLVKHFGKTTQLRDITDAKLAELIAIRRGEGVSNATVNRSVTEPLRKIMRRSVEVWHQNVPRPPKWARHMLPEPKERIREFSEDEEAKLFAALRSDYHPLLRFCLATGVRMRDAVRLTWTAIDWRGGVIRLVVKRDKPHIIPLTSDVTAILRPLRKHHETAVFTYEAKRARGGRARGHRYPITYNGLKSAWRRGRDASTVGDARFHDSRHTAATRLLRATGNIRVVQRLLGHEDIATTAKYAHAQLDDVRQGMEKVGEERRRTKKRQRRTI